MSRSRGKAGGIFPTKTDEQNDALSQGVRLLADRETLADAKRYDGVLCEVVGRFARRNSDAGPGWNGQIVVSEIVAKSRYRGPRERPKQAKDLSGEDAEKILMEQIFGEQ